MAIDTRLISHCYISKRSSATVWVSGKTHFWYVFTGFLKDYLLPFWTAMKGCILNMPLLYIRKVKSTFCTLLYSQRVICFSITFRESIETSGQCKSSCDTIDLRILWCGVLEVRQQKSWETWPHTCTARHIKS